MIETQFNPGSDGKDGSALLEAVAFARIIFQRTGSDFDMFCLPLATVFTGLAAIS
jgi:hypothetical protein